MQIAPALMEWSTDRVAASQRFDYYAHALSTALVPMRLTAPEPQGFRSVMNMVDFGQATVLRQHGTARRCFREAHDPAFERAFVVVSNLAGSCDITHRGRSTLRPGDVTVIDTGSEFDLNMFAPYATVGVKVSETWMKQWLPSPAALVGRRIPAHSDWGRALASFLAQLSAERLKRLPIPASVLVDHLGALLALTASEYGFTMPKATRAEASLHERIDDCIAQRCADSTLTASDVAASLGISTRTLHRSLAAGRDSFGAKLIASRADLAHRMLQSPSMRRLTIAEIGRRAGFVDASHFSRVLRRRLGRSPKEVRSGLLQARH